MVALGIVIRVLLQLNMVIWNERTCAEAALYGKLEILKWLRTNGCPWDKRVCDYAIKFGYMELLKWARENNCPK